MSEFLKQHTLYLTPLSPIHMGSGEEFEPTSYVIDNDFLQLFDPSHLRLPAQLRNQLLNIANRKLPDVSNKSGQQACVKYILDLHSWFKSNQLIIAQSAHHFIPLSKSVSYEYNHAFGEKRNEGEAVNQFVIERTAYHPITRKAYISGTAFKGMLRTTWLEHLSAEQKRSIEQLKVGQERENNYEKTLLNAFEKDPMRLFKPADFMPTGEEVYTSIEYSINKYKKQPDDLSKEPQGLKTRRESILPGQYRAFCSQTVIQQTMGKIAVTQLTMRELAKKSNHYYLKRFQKECQLMMNRGFLDEEWFKSTTQLLHALDMKLQMGDIMLIRLGKNTGAESKTDDQFASIKIMQGGGQSPKFEKETKTLWLASSNSKATNKMLPFGWAFVEIDPESTTAVLEQWCEENETLKTYSERVQVLKKEQQIRQEEALKQAKEEEEKAREKAEREAKEAEALANMSVAEKIIYDIKECFNQPDLKAGNEEGQKALAFLEKQFTQAQSMSAKDQKIIAEGLPFSTFKEVVSKKREKEIKALLRVLRGEE